MNPYRNVWFSGFLVLLLLAGCTQLGPEPVPSETPWLEPTATTATIRIGVVPEAASVTIGSSASYTLRDKVTGAVLLTGADEILKVELGGAAVIHEDYRLQVSCASASARDAWLERAQAEGYPTYTEEVPAANCWRLFIGEFPKDAPFAVRDAFRNEVIAKGLAGSDSFWKIVIYSEGSTEYIVTRGSERVTSANPVVLESSDNLVSIAGKPYRGTAEVAVNSKGTLAAINDLPLEAYLYGVVPLELPPDPYNLLEGQKAQAVAARTYALANLGKRGADGYDLLTTTSDQVYGGYSAEQAVSTQAVDETQGVVLTYAGELADALYHSTSGGHTANNEDVYNSAPVPYLRGVPNIRKGQRPVMSLEAFRNAKGLTQLRNFPFPKRDVEADWSRYYRWTFSWTAEEIRQVVSAYAGQDVGRVYALRVRSRSSSGRVFQIDYVTEKGTFSDTKDHIRTSLKYFSATGTMSPLLSTLFFVVPTYDRKTRELGFTAYGGGWGHGVGMSQTGAVGMAEQGYDYKGILEHYYTDITLEDRY